MIAKSILARNRYGRKLLWLFFHRRPGHSPRSLPLLLTVSQAAQALGVHVNTVRAWDRSGLLRSIRVGPRRDRRFPRELIMPLVTNRLMSEPLGFGVSGGGRGRRARFGFMLLTLLTAAAILLVSNKQTPAAAESAERQSFLPASCSGWINALNVETFDLTRLASAAAFSEANSVVFRSRPAGPDDLSGSLDAATIFQCRGWQVPGRDLASELQDVQLRISLAGIGPSDGEDVITLETSTDGATWLAQKTFLLRDELSNATNDGYMLVPVAGVSNVDLLRALQVRFVPNVVSSPSPSSFLIDGIVIEAMVKPAGNLDRQRLEPGVCAGWSNAAAAQRINEKDNAPYKQFSERDSAMVERRTAQAEPDSTTSSTAKLTCTGFGVLKAAFGKNVVDARVVFSLAARGGADSEDVVIPAYSVDGGQSWQTLDPVLVRGELSNRERNGYLSLTLPPTLTRDQLANLTVRLEFVTGEVPDETRVLLDGVALDLSLAKVAKDKRRDFEGLSFLTKRYFLPIEDPVIFLEAEPDSVEVFDARGERVDIAYSTGKESGAGGVRQRLELKHQRAIRPGTYTVKLSSKSGKRVVEETQTFSWGLLSINSPKTTYRVGESVPITVGVVDAAGRTVCNADLELFVTAPDGKTATARTSDGTMATSAQCGPKSITALPDYLYRFKADRAGTYSLSLEAETASGPQTLTSTVEVTDQPAFTIERVGPTRINPKQPYLMHLFVTPESDTKGVVTENIPLGFTVSEVSSGGSVATLDEPHQKVRWDVDWKTGQEYELTYVFDAPDVSPALFTLGPAEVNGQPEIRSWQVASDEVVETDRPGLAYDALKPMPDDWEAAHASLAAPIKPIFRADETAVVKIWDQGFAETGRPATPLTVANLEIVPPPGASAGFDKATEEFVKDGRERSVIYAVPNDTFKPGAYTLRATVTDGASSRIEEVVFEWGTLGLAVDKLAPKRKTRLTFALNDRDESGTPTCDDRLTLAVTTPSQQVVMLKTDDGSIRRVDCNDPNKQFETTFSPGEVGEYHALLTRRRGETERYVESVFTVVERSATPNDVQKSITQAVDLTAASFRAGEEPSLDVTVVDSAVMGFLGVESTPRDVTGLTLTSPDGSRHDLAVRRVDRKRGGDFVARLSVDTGSFSRPGKYTLSVDVEQGDYLTTVTQDFTWGVLAVNVRRSIELPNSSTDIGMAVLDDRGRTICDADVTLEVRNPKGKTETFRTSDGSIVRDPACVDKGVTNDPDYAATYRTTVNGTYIMTVTADTKNGRRSLTDQFEVRPDAAFDVERSVFPTRIYPLANYAVGLTIVPRQDFRGRVTETVPVSLKVADISPTASVAEDRQGHRTLTWEVDWRQGESYRFSYLIDFPDVAPAFYLLGPIVISDASAGAAPIFQEARQWQIASDATTIRVAGTLYSNEGTTAIDCSAANKTVKLEVNNTTGYTTTCTLAAGTYDFGTTISVNASDVLTIYISGATEKGSRTTRVAATPADITGADIYQNRAIVSHEDSGPITNTNLDNWDSGNDADVPYTVTTGALTVASGRKLIVWTGKTFTPGGSVTTTAASNQSNPDGDLDVQATATLSMGTNALSVGGDYNNAGTFSKSTGQTTTFTGTTTGFTIAPGTGNFDSVTFNGSGGGWSFSSAVILDVNLTMTAGTLSGTNNVTVNGGNATGNGTITLTGGTFLIDGAGNFGGTTAWTFSSLTFGDGTGTTTTTATSTSTITVASVMTISTSQTLSAGSKTYTLSGSGTPFVVSGTFTRATSTVNYTGSSATTIKNGITYNNLGIGISDANSVTYSFSTTATGANGTTTVASGDTFSLGTRFDVGDSSTPGATLVLNGTISGSYMQYWASAAFPTGGTMNATLWMNGGASGSQTLSARTYGGSLQLLCFCGDTITFAAGRLTFNSNVSIAENSNGVNYTIDAATNDPTVNVTGSIDYNGNSGTTGVEILNTGAGTWTVGGNIDFNDAGGQAGQFNTETGNLLKMTGTTKTINTGGNSLLNFEVASGGSNNVTMSANTTVSGDLTITSGALTAPSSGTLTIGGTFTNNSTFTHNSSTVVMNGTSKNIAGSSNTAFNSLTISGTITLTASNPTIATLLTVDVSKSLTINSGLTIALTRNNASDSLTLNGTINGPGRLTYQNATANSFTTSGTLGAGLIVRFDTVNGNLTIPARTDYGAIEAYGGSANARTVTLDTAASQTITASSYFYVIADASLLNNVTVSATTNNPTMNIGGDLDFTGTGMASEVIQSGTGTWTVSGSVDFTNGTYTATSGTTLTMNGTSKTLTSAGQSLYNFTVSGGSVTVGDTTAITNDLSVTGGTMFGTSNITVNGAATGTAGVVNLTGGTFEQRVNASKNFGPTTASTNWTFSTLTFSNSNAGATPITITAQSCSTCGVTVSSVLNIGKTGDIAGATTTLDAGDKTWTLSGSGTPLTLLVVPAAVFTANISTITYSSTTAPTLTNVTYYNLTLAPPGAGGPTYVLPSGTLTVNNNLTVGDGTNAVTVSNTTNNTVVNVSADLTINASGTLSGSGTGTFTVNGNVTGAGTVNLSGNTFEQRVAAAKNFGASGGSNAWTFNHLTFSNSHASSAFTITYQTGASGDTSVAGTLTVSKVGDAAATTLSLASGRTLTSGTAGTVTINSSGTISGSGTLIVQNSSLGTGGTLSSVVRFDATSGNVTVPARTYGGNVEAYSNSSSAARSVILGSGTQTLSGALAVTANNSQNLTLDGATNDPTLNLTGNLSMSKPSTGTPIITAPDTGSVTWTMSGSIDFSNGTYTKGTETLTMNGTGTLTTNSNTLNNFTTSGSGTITLANATHTIAGNLNFGGSATISAGSSTVTMSGTSKTIDGGGQTLANLTISGTATLQNTDLTASGTLNVADAKTLTIDVSRSLTLSGNSGTTLNLNTSGTVTGSGTLVYQNSATTVTTAGTLSSAFTFDLLNGNETIPNRTFSGLVTGLNTTSLARTLLFGASVTPTFSASLDVKTTGTGTLLLDGATNNPTTVTVTGNVTASAANGAITVSMGSGTWSVSGNFNLTNVTTFNHNSGSLTLSGTGTLTSNGQTLNNLNINSSGTVTLATATHTLVGNLLLAGSGTPTVTGSTIAMTGTTKTIDGGGKTLSGLTVSGDTTLQNTDLTVSGTLQVDVNKTLTINTSRTLTHSSATLTLNGTITGAGTYVYQSGTAFPTGGTISSLLRFDATNNNQIVSARPYGGQVELYSNSSTAARTVTMVSGTLTFSSHLYLNAANSQDLMLDGSTNSPTVNVTGDLDFTGAGTGMEVIAAGAGTWTISGSVNFTDGFFAPSVTDLTPTRDRAVKGQFDYLDVGQCPGTKLYSCESETATVLTFGQQINGECGRGADWTDYGWRAGLKYDLSSIPATATVTSAYFAASVAATLTPSSESVTIGHAATDTPNLDACNEALMADLAPTSYANVVWSTTGSKRVNLGSTAISDIQSRVATGSVIALAVDKTTISPPVYGWVEGSINSSESSTGKPTLRVGYVPSGSTAKLVMNGTGTLTTNGFPLNNLDLSGSVTLAGATHTLYGNLNMTGGTVTSGSSTVVMAGPSKTLTGGAQTLNNLTASADTTVQTSNLTVSGALIINSGKTLTITGVSLTHSGSGMTLTGTVAGTGTLIFTDTSSGPGTTGTLTAPVRFDATNGNIAGTTLDGRTYGGVVELYSNSGTAKTVSTVAGGTYVFSSTLTQTAAGAGSLTFDMNTTDPTAVTVTGTTIVGTGTTLSATSSGAFNVNGNYTNNGTFTDNSGTVTLAGTSQQTLSGTMTGSSDFNNLTITNSSGSDPDSSPSVILSSAVDTAGTLTAATANVKLRFNAGSSYAWYAINLNGQATGTRVFLRSSSPGTQYNLNAGAGSRTVSNTNFRDANACGSSGGSIDASDGTNVDAANNSCLTLNTITISISDTTIGFGACSASAARYATGDTSGSASDSADAHTVTVSSNATSGYALTVTGATLTSGANTITVIGSSATASSPGSEQFGMRVIKNSGTGTVSSPYDTSNWAYAGASSTSQIASHTSSASSTVYGLRYLCNINAVTEPGSYSTTLTYIMSAVF